MPLDGAVWRWRDGADLRVARSAGDRHGIGPRLACQIDGQRCTGIARLSRTADCCARSGMCLDMFLDACLDMRLDVFRYLFGHVFRHML